MSLALIGSQLCRVERRLEVHGARKTGIAAPTTCVRGEVLAQPTSLARNLVTRLTVLALKETPVCERDADFRENG